MGGKRERRPSIDGEKGVRMVPIETPTGTYKVWTKKIGANPRVKVLLLHGGPAMTTEYMECFGDYLPQEGYEMYYYHQLGSYLSDQPDNDDLWTIERFVEEVEQVRSALGLNQDNGYLIGNSWGTVLGLEYALKYQGNIKALVAANRTRVACARSVEPARPRSRAGRELPPRRPPGEQRPRGDRAATRAVRTPRRGQ